MDLTRTRKRIIIAELASLLMLSSFGLGNAADVKPPIPPPAKPAAPMATSAPAPTGTIDVKFDKEKGLLSVKAEKADLVTLLKKVGEVMAIPVEVGAGVSGTVTLNWQDKPEKEIDKILTAAGEKNFLTEYSRKPGAKRDEFSIEKIVVLKKADPKAEAAASEAIRKRDEEYRKFFAEMDKDGNKIARAIKEFQDPDTSERERAKLRKYLELANIDKPEDKKVLKAAILDRKYQGEIVGPIQMALMHGIQKHPEEDDKELILDVLKMRENRVGWLYDAMPVVWDERYVPFLLEDARKPHDVTSIRILGAMKVKSALPIIEEAILSSKKGSSRRSVAFDAYLQMTGQKFQFKDDTGNGNPSNRGGAK
jgi:hypothetical protein